MCVIHIYIYMYLIIRSNERYYLSSICYLIMRLLCLDASGFKLFFLILMWDRGRIYTYIMYIYIFISYRRSYITRFNAGVNTGRLEIRHTIVVALFLARGRHSSQRRKIDLSSSTTWRHMDFVEKNLSSDSSQSLLNVDSLREMQYILICILF